METQSKPHHLTNSILASHLMPHIDAFLCLSVYLHDDKQTFPVKVWNELVNPNFSLIPHLHLVAENSSLNTVCQKGQRVCTALHISFKVQQNVESLYEEVSFYKTSLKQYHETWNGFKRVSGLSFITTRCPEHRSILSHSDSDSVRRISAKKSIWHHQSQLKNWSNVYGGS